MTVMEVPIRSAPYRHGWHDGRYAEPRCFTENPRLPWLETPSDRLDYYRGHREGREVRARDARLPEAS